jgi:hypothetical protein
MDLARRSAELIRRHWFYAAFPLLVLCVFLLSSLDDWSRPAASEAAVLLGLCVLAPLLFLACYAGSLRPWPMVVRMLAIVCLGLYLASRILEDRPDTLIAQLAWFRTAGLAALALLELGVLIGLLKLVFSRDAGVDDVVAKSGAPRWVAQLLLLEARFWRAAWGFVRPRR